MSCFSKLFQDSQEYNTIINSIKKQRLPMGALGLSQAPKAHLIHSLCEDFSRKALVVLPDESSANRIAGDLNSLGSNAIVYPARDFTFRQTQGQSREFERQRLGVLSRIMNNDYTVIVCSAEAASQFTIPVNELKNRSISLSVGDEIQISRVVDALLKAGYVRSDLVEGTGQYTVRGGILDFFPPDCQEPIRIEFWGDNIDSISYFNPASQRRNESINKIGITPSTEVLFDSNEQLANAIEGFALLLKGKGSQKAKQNLLLDVENIKNNIRLGSIDRYLSLAYKQSATIFDYCKEDLLFVSETSAVKERLNASIALLNEEIKIMFEDGNLCKGLDKFSIGFSEIIRKYEELGAIYLDNFARGSFDTPVKELTTFNVQQISGWEGSLAVLLDDIRPAMQRGYTAVIMAGTAKASVALSEDLISEGIKSIYFPSRPSVFQSGSVNIISGSISAGMDYPAQKIMLISVGRQTGSIRRPSKKGFKVSEGFNSLEELSKGDYIVHSVHGIGVFDGIKNMDVGGIVKDYIKINYALNDVLYVPVTQLDLVSKYIGPHEGDKSVKVTRLGSKDWEKAKTRVRKAVKDMAKELIALYAKRVNTKGFAFSADIDMQNDFERRFEFEETEDQLRCIYEIKGDMEKLYPMDRLLCGDVGFGKTEVALRAAFKCIADGKQCVILVPTTILALQHYQTILKRFEGFPIESEMLSRFRTPKQQEKIIKGIRRGSVDIIVGTHRLLSKDLQFKDLGLLIVDEEQRFGVMQKEKMKELFPNVDVLTLTATPIPRTLNMAMSGIRDMSLIEEAPQDRYPVQTYVIEHDMAILAEAMSKELRRGGQVYYLHNRIESIDDAATKIKEYLPDARIGIAHGKMAEDELSEIWRLLLEGEIDILVCTTIIETGVDVANVNTLIIENADNMGLSQLHQIRGRVGRSARRAAAYFTFVRGKELTEIASRRLSAIREYTEFGSGFKIAMRDLEIRGAGNILGSQQHGHMEAVGYDMYLKLLAQAVSEEKGEAPKEAQLECLIDIQIDAHIPEKYIDSLPQRLAIYRRIADIRTNDDAIDVMDELTDRFGEPPNAVMGLIRISKFRNAAAASNIYEIGQRGDSILLYSHEIDMEKVSVLASKMRGRIFVSAAKKPYISIKKLANQSSIDTLSEIFGAFST